MSTSACSHSRVGEVLKNRAVEKCSLSPEEFVVATLELAACSYSGRTADLSQV